MKDPGEPAVCSDLLYTSIQHIVIRSHISGHMPSEGVQERAERLKCEDTFP